MSEKLSVVIEPFKDSTRDNMLFEKGEIYEGSLERINYLQSLNIVIMLPEEFQADTTAKTEKTTDIDLQKDKINEEVADEKTNPEDVMIAEYAKHIGRGLYELKNGQRIRGKKNVIEAISKLKAEDNG